MSVIDVIKNSLFYKNFFKIIIPFIILLILYLLFVYGMIIPTLEKNLYNEKISTTKRLSQLLYSDLSTRNEEILQGLVSEEEHKQRVIRRYEKLRFGKDNSDYFWIMDERGYIIMHPYIKSIVNVDPKTVRGPDGILLNKLLDMINETVKDNNSGLVEYMWQFNENPNILTKKISWVTKFEPWNWVIGAGVYLDDIKKDISIWKKKLLLYGSLMIALSMLINLLISIKSIKLKISEQEALKKLIKSEDRIKTTLLSIGDAVISTDTSGKIIQINKIAKQILNIQFTEQQDLYIYDIIKIKEINADRLLIHNKDSYFQALERLIKIKECLLLVNSKSPINISINANYIKKSDTEIEGLVIVFQDITKELVLKNEVIQNEELFRTIFEISPFFMTILTLNDLKYLMVNQTFIDASQLDISNIIGKKPEELNMQIDEFDDISFKILKQTGKLDNQLKTIKLNDESHFLMYSSRIIKYKDNLCICSIYSDITELKNLQEQLNHAQKMDAVGQLAGGIAHDFNNIIGGMLGIIELMTIKDYSYEERMKNLKILLNSGQRASDLTKKLLIFSRKGKIDSTQISVHKAINDAVALLERTVNKTVNIKLNLKSEQYHIIGDYTQLMNIFLNMGINADHAMPKGGYILIETENVLLDNEFCKNSLFDIKPGNFIKINVQDTGTGIKKEHLNKIFEPFFTTKEQGKGTGLGLPAVYGTVQQHHGAIFVKSKLNEGTTFTIYLPIVEYNEEKQQYETKLTHGSGTILIVDDEYIIQVMAKAVLENMGYSVIIANNGKEALDIYLNMQDNIDLVILDMIMPEMNGKECFKQLKKINKDVKVILSSGFSQESDIEELKLAGLNGFIRKPYNTAEISKIISNILYRKQN
ncbi:MAG: cache domain-containing protein [Candidatus Cloacimonetes bacterium]|nr:cache domain-containing protein [Candidatus Cloacimonadota bacterium]MDD4155479.1 cache domain-containing protein [Candidatus Cloacimonadota bacterium]